MGFEAFKKDELIEIAETFGVSIDKRMNPARLIEEIESEGVTEEMYQEHLGLVAQQQALKEQSGGVEPEPSEPDIKSQIVAGEFSARNGNKQLVLMTRGNPSYSIMGFNFTNKHPFVLMAPDDAQRIISLVDGFRLATPSEAEEFYAK